MNTEIGTTSASARERARKVDGRFGQQAFDRAGRVDLTGPPLPLPDNGETVRFTSKEVPTLPPGMEVSVWNIDGDLGASAERVMDLPADWDEELTEFTVAHGRGAWGEAHRRHGSDELVIEGREVEVAGGTVEQALSAADPDGAIAEADIDEVRQSAQIAHDTADTAATQATRILEQWGLERVSEQQEVDDPADLKLDEEQRSQAHYDTLQALRENWGRVEQIAAWRRANVPPDSPQGQLYPSGHDYRSADNVAESVADAYLWDPDPVALSDGLSGPAAGDLDIDTSWQDRSPELSDDGGMIFE